MFHLSEEWLHPEELSNLTFCCGATERRGESKAFKKGRNQINEMLSEGRLPRPADIAT